MSHRYDSLTISLSPVYIYCVLWVLCCRSFKPVCIVIMIAFIFLSITSMSITAAPPPLPLLSVYTASYCEENVYLLAKQFLDDSLVSSLWEVHVLFISNPSKSVCSPSYLAPSRTPHVCTATSILIVLAFRMLALRIQINC